MLTLPEANMVNRQPGRPSEREFTGAALRLTQNNYETQPVHMLMGYYANVIMVQSGRAYDLDIIHREQMADGFPGFPESLEDFAIRQLAAYNKHKR